MPRAADLPNFKSQSRHGLHAQSARLKARASCGAIGDPARGDQTP